MIFPGCLELYHRLLVRILPQLKVKFICPGQVRFYFERSGGLQSDVEAGGHGNMTKIAEIEKDLNAKHFQCINNF